MGYSKRHRSSNMFLKLIYILLVLSLVNCQGSESRTDNKDTRTGFTAGILSLLPLDSADLAPLAVIFLVFMTGLLFANSLQSGLLPPAAASKKVDFGPTEFVDSRQPVDSILTALEPKFSSPDQRPENNQ